MTSVTHKKLVTFERVIGLHADAIWLAYNAYMVRYMSRTVKQRKSTKMTNVGTVVLIGIKYALDACYIALKCSDMTPLKL